MRTRADRGSECPPAQRRCENRPDPAGKTIRLGEGKFRAKGALELISRHPPCVLSGGCRALWQGSIPSRTHESLGRDDQRISRGSAFGRGERAQEWGGGHGTEDADLAEDEAKVGEPGVPLRIDERCECEGRDIFHYRRQWCFLTSLLPRDDGALAVVSGRQENTVSVAKRPWYGSSPAPKSPRQAIASSATPTHGRLLLPVPTGRSSRSRSRRGAVTPAVRIALIPPCATTAPSSPSFAQRARKSSTSTTVLLPEAFGPMSTVGASRSKFSSTSRRSFQKFFHSQASKRQHRAAAYTRPAPPAKGPPPTSARPHPEAPAPDPRSDPRGCSSPTDTRSRSSGVVDPEPPRWTLGARSGSRQLPATSRARKASPARPRRARPRARRGPGTRASRRRRTSAGGRWRGRGGSPGRGSGRGRRRGDQ